MPSDTTPFSILNSLPTPRVWSMLVSIFGDLARNPGDQIDGRLLTSLTDGMGLKPEAVRVALHRLRNDAWIESTKSGRTARHALTAYGRKESMAASSLIYARVDHMPTEWIAAITETNDSTQKDEMTKAGFRQIAPRIFVAGANVPAPRSAIVLKGDAAPDWLRTTIIDPETTVQYQELLTHFMRVSDVLDVSPMTNPKDIALLRCLIVHHWRRLVLRHPFLPQALTGSDWPGHLCRQAVTELFDRLPRPQLAELRADNH